MKKIVLGLSLAGIGFLVISYTQDSSDTESINSDAFYDASDINPIVKIPGTERSVDISEVNDPISTIPFLELYNDPDTTDDFYIVEEDLGANVENRYVYYETTGLNQWLGQARSNLMPASQQSFDPEKLKAYKLIKDDNTFSLRAIELDTALPRSLQPPLPRPLQSSLDLSNGRFNEDQLAACPDNELEQVYSLNLSGNNLRDIPQIIRRMPNLFDLNLSRNQLTSLTGMPALSKLWTLILNHNLLRSLSSIPIFPELRGLYLAYNRFDSLAGLPALPNLGKLDLKGNDLRTFEGMPELPKLQSVNIVGTLMDPEPQLEFRRTHPLVFWDFM